jgi:flagellar biogenesis protein FliO
MRRIKHVEFYIGLIAASALFLAAEHLTHWEFLLHLAAIPLEILVAVFIVERFLELRENKQKRQQLLYIKSYMFRSEMRNLFIANFAALKHPAVRLDRLRSATLEELKEFRRQAESIEYASPEAMEPVIKEYVKAEPVWHAFKERAITYNFESIFHDMIFILHFICDVKIFLEKFPHRLFIQEAAKSDRRNQAVSRVRGRAQGERARDVRRNDGRLRPLDPNPRLGLTFDPSRFKKPDRPAENPNFSPGPPFLREDGPPGRADHLDGKTVGTTSA